LSGNPVFTLIYNSFGEMYRALGVVYFAPAANRALSQQFYRDLLRCAEAHDGAGAGQLALRTMQASQKLWDETSWEGRQAGAEVTGTSGDSYAAR
jgi:DNA-binding FadR family transcriptional regulator